LLVGATVLLTGCTLKEQARKFLQGDERLKPVVQVGETEYTQADLDRFFDSRLSDFRDPAHADRVKSRLLETFVEERLLLHEAERRHIEPNPEALRSTIEKIEASDVERATSGAARARDAQLERSVADSLKMQQYLHDYVLKNVSVSPGECEEYYGRHMGEYIRNDVAHVREILVDDQSLAERILASLAANQNKNFAELARIYSKAPTAPHGGDMGSFQRGELPEEFEHAIYPLAPATVSKIVPTKYGYHIFLVEEKIPAHQRRLYEVQDEIHEKLTLQRQRGLIDKEIETLLSRIQVEIHWDRLDFKYTGTRFGGFHP